MSEKEIERRMCVAVKYRGGLAYKFSSPNNPGVPDRIVINPAGDIWFVEIKSDSGRLSKLQKMRIAELEKRNCNVRIIWGWEDAKKFIGEVINDGI